MMLTLVLLYYAAFCPQSVFCHVVEDDDVVGPEAASGRTVLLDDSLYLHAGAVTLRVVYHLRISLDFGCHPRLAAPHLRHRHPHV